MNHQLPHPLTRGIHHLGLTVDDLNRAQHFFVDVLGFELLGQRESYPAAFVSDGKTLLSLWQVADQNSMIGFDRRNNIGLHHVALAVESTEALEAVHGRLQMSAGVEIVFAPEPLGTAGARHMMCLVPGGVRVEFIAPAGSNAERRS